MINRTRILFQRRALKTPISESFSEGMTITAVPDFHQGLDLRHPHRHDPVPAFMLYFDDVSA
ncbi:MAG: hypothetical protein CBC23_000395 [Rhodospirillaceae bacterium TMED63]|nr:hypothetical protein [Rhodospirillaceae bacterium]RPG04460.1 MAG: hypothetical protein CBC23_000395 [Rhodospirillaceae bacterium TMED63]